MTGGDLLSAGAFLIVHFSFLIQKGKTCKLNPANKSWKFLREVVIKKSLKAFSGIFVQERLIIFINGQIKVSNQEESKQEDTRAKSNQQQSKSAATDAGVEPLQQQKCKDE
jgi:hypothetical protein